ncbi:MAG: 2-succinyl-5-enolpyruvyl-6-hydroxy-3-cyclohexene-1-carboxylic-acid synthase [Flavobacteriaceae bacterium]|nr:2-succinyl-5-enolpyruvyl-6-hydroxy-3-cyclohexene-1-carboxylic-acid synthase [Flavobacteriaceae bacterium]
MKYPEIPLAQAITSACEFYKISQIVISPGSRNAPLTLGFTNNPCFENFSIVDERAAAFFALGMAQQTGKPVALVCTSGSALLNYYPAISEAYYSRIPLLILSADRPKHFIDIGDGQTIRQENVFANHIGYSANLTGIESQFSSDKEQIENAIKTCFTESLPVHVNIPLEEPLYNLTEKKQDFTFALLNKFEEREPQENIDHFLRDWQQSKRKMILCGVMPPDLINTEVTEMLAQDSHLIVLTETTSNWHHPHFINSIDKLIAPLADNDRNALCPEILLTVGGMVVSKKIKSFLRNCRSLKHYHVGDTVAYDTFFCLQKHIKTEPNDLFNMIKTSEASDEDTYRDQWLNYRNKHAANHDKYLDSIPFSDLKVFDKIFKTLPENVQLQLGNSSTIRYSQLFDVPPEIHVYCNRGTSGIDGSTSTAIGAAVASGRPTVLITGDLSFFYDSNALWNNYIPKDFIIILINNAGGGIFRILPGYEETDNFAHFFETTHTRTASLLAEMYGFTYLSAADEDNLNSCLQQCFLSKDKPVILEIMTPRLRNNEILTNYFESIQ